MTGCLPSCPDAAGQPCRSSGAAPPPGQGKISRLELSLIFQLGARERYHKLPYDGLSGSPTVTNVTGEPQTVCNVRDCRWRPGPLSGLRGRGTARTSHQDLPTWPPGKSAARYWARTKSGTRVRSGTRYYSGTRRWSAGPGGDAGPW